MYCPARAAAASSTSSVQSRRLPQGVRRFCQSSCSGSSTRSSSGSSRMAGSLRLRLSLLTGASSGSSSSSSSVADRRSPASGGSRSSSRDSWSGGVSSGSSRSSDSDGSVRPVSASSAALSATLACSARSAAESLNRLSDHSPSSASEVSRRALRDVLLGVCGWPKLLLGWISRSSSLASSSSRSRWSRSIVCACHAGGLTGTAGAVASTGAGSLASGVVTAGASTAGGCPVSVLWFSSCWAALNTCRQAPQRTTPRAMPNWAWLTRKLVWQCGHWVTKLSLMRPSGLGMVLF